MSDTKIEWTDKRWNPVRGCTRVSEGCRNCYAERMAARGMGPYADAAYARHTAAGPRWNGNVELIESKLLEPLRHPSWRGKRVFVNSMSDLFHEGLPDVVIKQVFAVMMLCPGVTFQVLTKRADRMAQIIGRPGFRSDVMVSAWTIACDCDSMPAYPKTPEGCGYCSQDQKFVIPAYDWPLPNVWLGVSVEDQKTADERIPSLLDTPAAVRFVSAEPLLGPVDFRPWLPSLDQIIAGGESGPGARPAHPDWFRAVRDQCAEAGVPWLFKQWGEWAPTNIVAGGDLGGDVRSGKTIIMHAPGNDEGYFRRGDVFMSRVGKKAAGRLLDGREHSEFPEAR